MEKRKFWPINEGNVVRFTTATLQPVPVFVSLRWHGIEQTYLYTNGTADPGLTRVVVPAGAAHCLADVR